jgi:protein-S-isoprenylcysteine O-methyltransferase Ste14
MEDIKYSSIFHSISKSYVKTFKLTSSIKGKYKLVYGFCCISMKFKGTPFLEIAIGLLLVVIGFILWLWSIQLFWILIYPQPLAKSLIETLPYVFWATGAILVIDGFRRWLKK